MSYREPTPCHVSIPTHFHTIIGVFPVITALFISLFPCVARASPSPAIPSQGRVGAQCTAMWQPDKTGVWKIMVSIQSKRCSGT
jgi:hypothetical protein